jgi:ribosomal protein S18 acetylase RimI-like enzyme
VLTEGITYRAMQLDDAPAVSDLALRTFRTYIAPSYRMEGIQTFTTYIQPQTIRGRLKLGALGLVSVVDDSIVGMIEMLGYSHVTLLFVDGAYQRRGISRELLRLMLDICRQRDPQLKEVTLNSSPYALEIYKHLGFVPTDMQQESNGILYTPMKLSEVDSL